MTHPTRFRASEAQFPGGESILSSGTSGRRSSNGERSVKGSCVRGEVQSVGRLEPDAVLIESARVDYVFGRLECFQAADEANLRMIGALTEGGVVSEQGAYLGTITFRASPDARGMFHITVRAEDTVLLDSAGQEIRARTTDNSPISVP